MKRTLTRVGTVSALLLLLLSVFHLAFASSNLVFTEHLIDNNVPNGIALYAVDMNADGHVDVLGSSRALRRVYLYLNDGLGNFTTQVIGTDDVSGFDVDDIDQDGDLDIAIAGNASAYSLLWYRNDGNLNFTRFIVHNFYVDVAAAHILDMDSDGDMDLLAAASGYDIPHIEWFENNGSEAFTRHAILPGSEYGDAENCQYIEPFDKDGDGDFDILTACGFNVPLFWLVNDGSQNFSRENISASFPQLNSISLADVDTDADIDVVVSDWQLGVFWLENINGTYSQHAVSSNINPTDTLAEDIDHDGDTDIIETGGTSYQVPIWLNDGNEHFEQFVMPTNYARTFTVISADINKDGLRDLITDSVQAGWISWHEQGRLNAAPTVSAQGPYSVDEGASVNLAASGFDPEGEPLTYAWDLDNDGVFETVGRNAVFSAALLDGPTSYPIAVQATDNGGASAIDYTTVEVQNIAPIAEFSGMPGVVNPGEPTTLTFSNQFDPSTEDTSAGFLYSYDCTGDGTFDLVDSSSATFVCPPYSAPGTISVVGRIKDNDGGSTDHQVAIVVNSPPVLSVGNVAVAADEGQTAVNSGNVSDIDGDFVLLSASEGLVIDNGDGTWSWSFITSDGPAQSQSITIDANDGRGGFAQVTFTVTVNNVSPIATAGADLTVVRTAAVNVSGTWTDPAANADAPYAWMWDLAGSVQSGSSAYGETATATTSYPLEGQYTLTFQVTDKDGGTGSDTLIVTVQNQTPVCDVALPSLDFLWPPEHQMMDVSILSVTDPEGDPVAITIMSIYQDEPTNGLGDGDTSPDGQGIGTPIATVRAERAGDGNGRMYHISFSADDGHNGVCTGSVLVGVNHDQGKKGEAVDDGALFDSTLP
ncbi:MAG: VCBS repeat-containing protein [Anaerolineae bacterium]|nr:VCBS repeat-containing protein [Anaerolineae bacterium]